MKKKGPILGIIIISIIAGIAALASSSDNESNSFEQYDVDMSRTHGSVSTALGSPVLGNPDAPITIVEFGDYQCHQCYNWFHDTKPLIMRDYIETGKANLVFVDFAFLGKDSPKAAQATYCADDQNMYWEYHGILYTSQESKIDSGWANTERLKAFAFSLNLDMELFNECLDSEKYSKRVQYNSQQARDNGVNGTPGFFIVGPDFNQKQIGGAQPFSVFKQVLDSMV
ncbi:disulfide isomerase/thiol-disulfide oxidase [Candidatus Nitrosomarinus catalina]|uniref:Disulfide isomerase/thiol-disulfide oxidase n=1 Tax=Candidatus Nitrosomarinus catalinensis TaxID=1898749 RepID=A0A2Z2HMI7_9ARCH|nr:DsbA family protein [Candidatus Nitrosomarinus catalina]ARS64667.1 disulfide isomerase/thiol-disulfide oxidase [Candidatus Nitrosomarinus catalina]